MERVEEFKMLLETFTKEYEKFTIKGVKQAGTRARKVLQDIRNLAKDTRDEITKTKNEMTKK